MQGAIGDVLCSTVALREVKRRYPECKLWVAVSGRAWPVLENLSYIDELFPHPAPIKRIVKTGYMIKAVEMVNTPAFDNLNMIKWLEIQTLFCRRWNSRCLYKSFSGWRIKTCICSLPEEDITVKIVLDVYGIRAANLSYLMKDIRYLIAAVYLSDAMITADTDTSHYRRIKKTYCFNFWSN